MEPQINYDLESKPPTTDSVAVQLLRQLYGIEAQKVKEVNAYDDRNYYVVASDKSEYIMKITNSVDSAKAGLLEGQNEMLLHLSLKGFAVSAPVKTVAGTFISRLPLPLPENNNASVNTSNGTLNPNGAEQRRSFAVRLLKWIPGTRLCDVKLTERQLEQCGDLLGRVDLALVGYENNAIRHRHHLWQLSSVNSILQHVNVLEPWQRELVERCVKNFQCSVMENLAALPQSYIHGDANEQNILVKEDNHSVSGLIDFGDISYGPRIFDISLLIAYITLLEIEAMDPISQAPGHILKGFLPHIDINEAEMNVIVCCVRARISQSLTLGAYTHSLHPENDYLLTTAKVGWRVLQRLCQCDDQELLKGWINIARR